MILRSIFNHHTTLEDPALSLDDPDLWDAVFNRHGEAGVQVTHESALGLPPFWRAVSLLTGDVGKLPLLTYRRRQDDGREKARQHPAWWLLKHQANEIMTADVFKRVLQYHLVIRGNAYAWIVRNRADEPIELLPLDPRRTKPDEVNGRLWYFSEMGGVGRAIPAANVLHLKGLSWDGVVGIDALKTWRSSLSLPLAIQRFLNRFFDRGARTSGVIELPAGKRVKPDAIDETRRQFEKIHAGVDNAFRIAILQEGAKWVETSMQNDHAELSKVSEMNRRDVANLFGIPPHKVGDTTRTSFKSLEEENRSYLQEGLDPWLCLWESELNAKLLSEAERRRESVFVEFLRAALLKTDTLTRFRAYQIAISSRVMNPNEARARENLNPYEGGDEFANPAITPGGPGDPEDEADGDAESGEDEAARADNSAVFPAGRDELDPVLADLALRIRAERDQKSQNQIAREFVRDVGSGGRAPETLLRQLRRMRAQALVRY